MLGRGRSPEFVLSDTQTVGSAQDAKILPIGTFVKPIERHYLPKHVLEDYRWRYETNDERYVFCYTQHGIVPILKEKVRQL